MKESDGKIPWSGTIIITRVKGRMKKKRERKCFLANGPCEANSVKLILVFKFGFTIDGKVAANLSAGYVLKHFLK